MNQPRSLRAVVPALGVGQILAWGSSYYLLAVLAEPIASETSWSRAWVVAGLSLGLLVAGLVSPRVGTSIHRVGGRLVLATSAALFALGLSGIALAPNLAVYFASWVILGCGMSAGLYDAAFATLGTLYGQRARSAITTLTLFGGFASAVCWPLSVLLVSTMGWRGACLVYAAIHLSLLLPLYLGVLPRRPTHARPTDASPTTALAASIPRGLFFLIALTTTLSAAIFALLAVHLLEILQAGGVSLAGAVALGALVGPAQVSARAIEMAIGPFHHPLWTKVASVLLVSGGIGLLWSNASIVAVALVSYGAGIGLESIARGTVPLAVFGEQHFPKIMSRIAMPSLIAQAASPALGALLLESQGAHTTLTLILIATCFNLALVAAVFVALRRRGAQAHA